MWQFRCPAVTCGSFVAAGSCLFSLGAQSTESVFLSYSACWIFSFYPFFVRVRTNESVASPANPFFPTLRFTWPPRRPHVLLSVPLRECGAVFLNLSSLSSTKFFLISFLSAFFRSLTPIQCIFTYSCRVARVFSNTSHSERRAKRGFFYPPPCDIMAVQMLLCACPSPSGFSPSAAFEDS